MLNLLPKDETFFDELEQLAQHVTGSSENLEEITQDFPRLDGPLPAIERHRREARDVYQSSLARLDRAFITPIDRDDILTLITELYGVVDRVAELSQRFRLYRLSKIYPTLAAQAKNLEKLARELEGIIGGLRRQQKLAAMGGQMEAVTTIMEAVKQDRENFLGSLFAEPADPLDVFKKKELHDLLEEVMERCEGVTETLARVLLKNG